MEQKEKTVLENPKSKRSKTSQYGHFSLSEIRTSIQADAQELFSRANIGGTIGIYIEEGLPLYFVSDQLLQALGMTYEQYYNKFGTNFLETIHPGDRDEYMSAISAAYESKESFDYISRVPLEDHSVILMRDIGKLIKTLDNRDAFLILRTDVTDVLKQQKALEEKALWYEEKTKELAALTANIPGGVCEVELDEYFSLVYGNDGFYHLFGYTARQYEKEHGNRLLDSIYEKDKDYVADIIFHAFQEKKSVFEFEHRIIRRDNSVIWILVRGSFSCYQKRPLFNCVVIDITERKRIEDEARMNERRFRIALAQTDNTIFEYDIKKRIMIHGDRSANYYGLQQTTENVPDALVTGGTVHPDTASDFLDMYKQISNGAAAASCRIKARLQNGQYAWRKITLTAIYDENQVPVQAIGFLEDIDEQVKREESLRYQSERDTLTELYNRGAMEHKIRTELALREEHMISAMIIIDIDDFKSVNDRYGHMFGDSVLSNSALRISSLFRKDEIIGRIGGDEYMAFINRLPSETVACSCAQRIADTFRSCFTERGITVDVSCSIGVALCPTDGITFEDLYQNADIALYEAKKRGKNQVVCYNKEMTITDTWIPHSNTRIDQ